MKGRKGNELKLQIMSQNEWISLSITLSTMDTVGQSSRLQTEWREMCNSKLKR